MFPILILAKDRLCSKTIENIWIDKKKVTEFKSDKGKQNEILIYLI